ncbi:restriction endonuclease subunit S [Paenibacillus psychroresistens]|uniref:Restriction endonuclease subunit S n=1 Tax=Paenibacillus psychroresistens TaxID=1778678 RepID=A0A6B8RNE5_9BACL|nr:restriction endonuclease subunit S [Paenibacillus psychroresistens]QGQ97549.1 restriction endonuclease subunit S [Paenibacillus psychroresistens]
MGEFKNREAEELKNSGVEWNGGIPREWSSKKLKHISFCFPSNVDKKTKLGEIPIKLCNYTDVYYHKYITANIEFMNATATSAQIIRFSLKSGDILLTKDSESPSDIGVASYVIDNITDLVCGYHITIVKVFEQYNSLYYYYYLLSTGVKNYFETVANGITRYGIGVDGFNNTPVIIPSEGQQQKIANFLYIKTAQFDSIISKKEQLIQKLEEAKKSMISEVITGKVKIVDGEMVKRQPEEMKDSGVEWLGMIPKDWEITRIKNLFSLRNERNKKSMDSVQILSLYTALGVKRQEEIENKTGNIVRTVFDYKIVHPNDIVVNIILAWMGAIGMSRDRGVISPAYDIYKPNRFVNSNYYNHLFRTSKFTGECFKYGRGIMLMRWRTYSDEFMSINCCKPLLAEQEKISEFIDIKNNNIDSVIAKNKTQIQKLKQAKQSLISEAVTGKINLTDWEIIEEGGVQ